MPSFRFFLSSFVRSFVGWLHSCVCFVDSFVRDDRSLITFVRSFADSLVRWLRSCFRLFIINVTNDLFDRSINCLFS